MEKCHLDYYEAILNHHFDVIIKLLNLSSLLPHLQQRGLLTEQENEQLRKHHTTNFEKNSEFLHILKTKGFRAFNLFLDALKAENAHLGHEDLYMILKDEAVQAAERSHAQVAVHPTNRLNRSPQQLSTSIVAHRGLPHAADYSELTSDGFGYTAGATSQYKPPVVLPAIKQLPLGNETESESSSESAGSNYRDHIQSPALRHAGHHGQSNIMPSSGRIVDHRSEVESFIQPILENQLKVITRNIAEQLSSIHHDIDKKMQSLESQLDLKLANRNFHDSCSRILAITPSANSDYFRPLSRSSTATRSSLSSHSTCSEKSRSSVHDRVTDPKLTPKSRNICISQSSAEDINSDLEQSKNEYQSPSKETAKKQLFNKPYTHSPQITSPSEGSQVSRQLHYKTSGETDSDIDHISETFYANFDLSSKYFYLPCTCKPSQIPAIIFDFKAHLIHWVTTNHEGRIRDHCGSIQESLWIHDINNKSLQNQMIGKYSSRQFVCALVEVDNIVTLVGGCLNKTKNFNLELHQLSKATQPGCLEWEPVGSTYVELSTTELDPDNCICSNYHDKRFSLVTIISNLQHSQDSVIAYFHVYSLTETSTHRWKSAYVSLNTHLPLPSNFVYKPQSCVLTPKHIYYSLLCNNKINVYKLALDLLKKISGTQPLPPSAISCVRQFDTSVTQCFLSLYSRSVIAIAVNNNAKESIIEVSALPSKQIIKCFDHFNSIIRVVAVNTMDNSIGIVYHDSKTAKCCLEHVQL